MRNDWYSFWLFRADVALWLTPDVLSACKEKQASEAPKLTNRFVQYTDTINRFAIIEALERLRRR